MTVTYDTTMKTARMTATRDAVANGTLEILTSADALLATWGLDAAGGTISGAVWTLVLDATQITPSATGIAAKAQIKNSGGTARVTGLTVTATGGGGDIQFGSTSFSTGIQQTLTSATVTHAT